MGATKSRMSPNLQTMVFFATVAGGTYLRAGRRRRHRASLMKLPGPKVFPGSRAFGAMARAAAAAAVLERPLVMEEQPMGLYSSVETGARTYQRMLQTISTHTDTRGSPSAATPRQTKKLVGKRGLYGEKLPAPTGSRTYRAILKTARRVHAKERLSSSKSEPHSMLASFEASPLKQIPEAASAWMRKALQEQKLGAVKKLEMQTQVPLLSAIKPKAKRTRSGQKARGSQSINSAMAKTLRQVNTALQEVTTQYASLEKEHADVKKTMLDLEKQVEQLQSLVRTTSSQLQEAWSECKDAKFQASTATILAISSTPSQPETVCGAVVLAAEENNLRPVSEMSKEDLEMECETRCLDGTGSLPMLRARVRAARAKANKL